MSEHDEVEDDDEDEKCPGEEYCDNAWCDERETYHVEIEFTVKFEMRAHSEDEALELAQDIQISADEPSDERIEGLIDTDYDWFVTSETDKRNQEAKSRAMMAQIEKEMAEKGEHEVQA